VSTEVPPSEETLEEKAPEESTLDELADDLNPVADLGETLSKLHNRYLIAMLATYLLAAVVAMLAVLFNPVRDWPLFGGMYLVVISYMILYIKATQRGRPVLRFLSLIISEGLLAFWIWVQLDRIPPRKVFYGGEVVERPELTLLWVPIVLLGFVALILLSHWLYLGRLTEKRL